MGMADGMGERERGRELGIVARRPKVQKGKGNQNIWII